MTEKNSELKRKMKKTLDKDRYQHTLGVAYTASCLAMRYGADINDAFTAGLLHDCAKCLPAEEEVRLCIEKHVPVTDFELQHTALLHAKLGYVLAKECSCPSNRTSSSSTAYLSHG